MLLSQDHLREINFHYCPHVQSIFVYWPICNAMRNPPSWMDFRSWAKNKNKSAKLYNFAVTQSLLMSTCRI